MFALGVIGLDLNDPNFRYFDVSLVENEYKNETFNELRRIYLEQCTVEHFSMT